MTCESCRERMVEAVYGELDARTAREFDEHIATCVECAALREEMRATVAVMSERRRPDPGEEYWSGYYARLEERMQREDAVVDGARNAARRRSSVSWGYRVAAAVAVLALGMWLGRSSTTRDHATVDPSMTASHDHADSSVQQLPDERIASSKRGGAIDDAPAQKPDHNPDAKDRVVLASADERTREYIERSQVLLLALVNSSPDTSRADGAGFQTQRERAGLLVREAASLRDDLPGSDNRRLRELVTDLQMILREIANLESQNDLQAVEIIRNRVDREGVLLKIDVEQMREENDAGPAQPKRGGAID